MHNQLKTVVLLGALSALLVAIGGALGPGYLYAFLALAVVMNFVSYFFSDRIVLAMHHAREVGPNELPEVHEIVNDLARRARIPKPRVYVLPEEQPNAFATGRNPEHSAVAVTAGILDILTARELRGVLAHELAHVRNRDILIGSIAAAIATAITFLAHALQFTAFFGSRDDEDRGGSPIGALALAILAPIAATLIQLAISRSREYRADESGAALAGDPEALASALEKLERGVARHPSSAQPATASLFIVSPLAGGDGLMSLFSTHPPLAERIRRLRQLACEGHIA
jgi:heat shock protein HtpX